MQAISDQCSLGIQINEELLEQVKYKTCELDDKVLFILKALLTLTRKNIVIPYHFDANNGVSCLVAERNAVYVANKQNGAWYPYVSLLIPVD